MGYQGVVVSTLFHPPRGANGGPPAHAVEVEIVLPRLGSAALEDAGDSLRLWLSDGTSMLVPKSTVSVVSRRGQSVKVDWNTERVHMEFSGTIAAWRASVMMTAVEEKLPERQPELAVT
jgi:hypothetical protein